MRGRRLPRDANHCPLGRIAAVVGEGDDRTFSVLVAERYFEQGANEVTLLVVDGDADTPSLRLIERT